jgi:GNAT superfamily N-acetyltransferase
MKRRNYHVKQVESTPNTEVLLRYMQREILPADRVICPSQGWWWVAYRGQEACGFGCLMQSSQWEDTVYLARAGVMLSHQGFGIQKRLISRRTAFARSIGMRWAVSDTTDNPASANSLIACGFKLFEPSKPWGSERTIYWRRDLAL